ncbi:MAG TPA: hypothetical protein DEA96_10185 [Leptospiraceae bacterium]|nr:hypothetical protein [Spirochaetaceae bacterium]HBS05325.1 hypothetical protein [Leptospiraceae bacterium]
MRRNFLTLLLWITSCSLCCTPGTIEVDDAYMPTPLNTRAAAVYLRITNNSELGAILTGGRADIASRVEVHRTEELEGLVKMKRLSETLVPAGDTVEFRPGALHLMLLDLNRIPEPGTEIELTLTFKHQPDRVIKIPVVSPQDALK